MQEFLKRGLLFFAFLLPPIIVLLLLYMHFDPFRVVKKTITHSLVATNRDFISTETYLANKEKYKYNSFIFGSSRAISFNTNSWIKHLDEQSIPFAFDASGESLFGIYTKLKFLEKEKTNLKNVLILFCRGKKYDAIFETKNYNKHIIIKHPKFTGESWLRFHFVFFKAYFNLKFLLGYYTYILTGQQNVLTHGIIQNGITIDYKSNQIRLDTFDNQLFRDPKGYYLSRRSIFYERNGERFETESKLTETHKKMLAEIKELLDKNQTNYKIILTPTYDQVRFSVRDKEILVKIFREHLYDFTGENFITKNDTNWYENDHFRPFIADSIMNIIYSEDSIGNKWR